MRQVFSKFPASEHGVSIYALLERYNSERHPDVRYMNRRPEELWEDFLAGVQNYIQMKVSRN